MTVIKGKALTTFDVAQDGASVSIKVADETAGESALVLPADCLSELMMTLPEMMRQSLQNRYRDSSLRMVYPADGWRIEQSDKRDVYILTLSTGGFQVSFGLSRADLEGMSDFEEMACPARH